MSPARRAAAAARAATPIIGSGRMHLQVTTLIEASAHTLTTVRRRRTTNTAGGLDDTLLFFEESRLEMGITMPSSQVTLFLPSVDPRRGFRLY